MKGLLRQIRGRSVCTYECDSDCDQTCHAVHEVTVRRIHQPDECPSSFADLIDSSGLLDTSEGDDA